MKKFLFLLSLAGFVACESNDCCDAPPELCDDEVIINKDRYQSDQNLISAVDTAILDNDACLVVHFSASGCNSGDAIVALVDSGDLAESDPPQRFAKLELISTTDCEAIFQHQRSFDISDILRENPEFVYNFKGMDGSILVK